MRTPAPRPTFEVPPSWARLHAALAIIAAADPDHARDDNGVGFSSADGAFGHRLVALGPPRWIPAMARGAWELAWRYRAQLAAAGIDTETLAVPQRCSGDARHQARVAANAMARVRVSMANGQAVVALARYEPAVVAALKAIEGRRFDGVANHIPPSGFATLCELGQRFGFALPPEVTRQPSTAETATSPRPAASRPTPPTRTPEGIDADTQGFVVRFAYDPNMVCRLKATLPQARWDREARCWRLVASPQIIGPLRCFAEVTGLSLSDAASHALQALEPASHAGPSPSTGTAPDTTTSLPTAIPGLALALHPYQAAGVDYILAHRRVLIADQMGLGKSIQAAAAIVAAGAFPAVVVCPAVAKCNWVAELAKFFPDASVAVQLPGATKAGFVSHLGASGTLVVRGPSGWVGAGAAFNIVNYDVLGAHGAALAALHPAALVLDESHYIKESEAARTRAALRLAAAVPPDGLVICLSGTPITNRPAELVPQLAALGRLEAFGGRWGFLRRYANAHRVPAGRHKLVWDYSGASHTTELHAALRASCYIRRSLADVMPDLPAKRSLTATVEPDPATYAAYQAAEADVVAYLAERAAALAKATGADPTEASWSAALRAQAAQHLVRIGVLKRLAGQCKVPATLAWVENLLDSSGDKCLIFAEQCEIVRSIAAHFVAPKIAGGEAAPARAAAAAAFQADPACRVLVCSTKAAGVALSLTAARHVVFAEQSWSPADHDQAVARAWGRVSDLHAVSVWTLLAEGTIDTLIAERLAAKSAVLAAVIDGEGAPESSVIGDVLAALAGRGLAKHQAPLSEESEAPPIPARAGSPSAARQPLRSPPRRPAPSTARHPTRNPMEVSR